MPDVNAVLSQMRKFTEVSTCSNTLYLCRVSLSESTFELHY